jgi:MFS family permease
MAKNSWQARNPSYVTIFTSSVGGLLEMYDFTIYAFLAPTLSQLFFSDASAQLGMILTFATFAVGYLVRPLGGILFGHMGDRLGRRIGLILSIFLMGAATFLIGCLPTYKIIGLLAPILLLLLRAIQGIAVGGDLPGGMTYLSEEVTSHRCGRYLGYLFAAINLGSLLAACTIFSLHATLSPSDFFSWGWRLPFGFSIVLSFLGLMQRRKLKESSVFKQLQNQEKLQRIPFAYLFQSHLLEFIKGSFLLAPFVLIVCQVFLYTPTYLSHFFGLSYAYALQLNCLGIGCFIVAFLLFGQLSDYLGSRRMPYLILALLIISPITYYTLLSLHGWVIATVFFSFCAGFCGIGLLHPFALLFPTSIRNTGIGVTYNILFALGGTIPAILTTTIPLTRNSILLPILFLAGTTILYVFSLFIRHKSTLVSVSTSQRILFSQGMENP